MYLITITAGLGDALGVDWASLVADVHRREQAAPAGGARDRWRPERVLSRVGLSFEMAGKDLVQNILQQNASSLQAEKTVDGEKSATANPTNVNDLHPVAAIQVRNFYVGSYCIVVIVLRLRL